MRKNRLRHIYRKKRKNLSPLLRRHYSRKICRSLLNLKQFKHSDTVLFYHPVDKEVNTSYLFEHSSLSDTRFVFPKADPQTRKLELFEVHSFEEHLQKGTFDIMEPVAHNQRKIHVSEIDVVLVPGLVFDQTGHRIGFGGGYFDRFLSITELRATTIGLAYSFQVVKKLPAEKHDQPLNYVLTETDLIHQL